MHEILQENWKISFENVLFSRIIDFNCFMARKYKYGGCMIFHCLTRNWTKHM